MTIATTTPGRFTDRAGDAVRAVLPASVDVRLVQDSRGGGLVVAGKRLRVVWAGEGSLGDARRALATAPLPDVVVARHLSSGARKELTEVGIGWVDETGAAEIATGSIIVSRSGRPPSKVEKPPRWTPAVLAVAEALLCGARATVADTQEVTGLSSGSCTNALRALTELGLLEASAERGRASARKVTDRRALLIAYAGAAESLRDPLSVQVGVTWRDPVAGLGQIGRRWSMAHTDWAVTGAVAASVIAPHLGTVTTADVYLDTNTIIGLKRPLRTLDSGPSKAAALPFGRSPRLLYVGSPRRLIAYGLRPGLGSMPTCSRRVYAVRTRASTSGGHRWSMTSPVAERHAGRPSAPWSGSSTTTEPDLSSSYSVVSSPNCSAPPVTISMPAPPTSTSRSISRSPSARSTPPGSSRRAHSVASRPGRHR